jgi:hypothetical protein
MYGNEAIWVVTSRTGTAQVGGNKIPTVRLIEGQLTAEARRLDGPAPPAHVSIPAGYEPVGFQAFGVDFPVPGCWELVQRLAGHELRLVYEVR